MFDEPLTVIDPHLKMVVLRSKLKELHQQIGMTMIYVTHDQTEALTFADQVVVMYDLGDGRPDRYAGRTVRAPGAYVRRPLHRIARHERTALRNIGTVQAVHRRPWNRAYEYARTRCKT